MGKFIKFIKRLADGGLAEDYEADMQQILDEYTNKEEMVNKQEFVEKACEIYKKHILKFNPALREFSTTLDEAVSVFRKQMEE